MTTGTSPIYRANLLSTSTGNAVRRRPFCLCTLVFCLAVVVIAPYCRGDVLLVAAIGDEKLFHLQMNIPPVHGLVVDSPGLTWEAKLRLFTYPPIWGNALSNVELRDMDWNSTQKDAYEARPEAAYLMAHKMIKDQTLYGRAAYLLELAAAKGHGPAQNDMGVLYFWGLGVPHDMRKAIAYFRQSSAQGDAMADLNLGLCSIFGMGVPQSYSKAEYYISSAARKKQPVAATILAASKAVGSPLARKDLDEAYKLVLCARVYGSDWPLEEKTSKNYSYFVDLDRLETFIAKQIPEERRERLQHQLSTAMPPSPPPSQTLSDRMGRQRQDHPQVVIIGPAVSAPATNTVAGGK